MPDLRPLIGYMVDQVIDQGGYVNKTALVKLVYLVDLEHYRRYSKLATGLHWRFHHYGPYAPELETAINDNAFVNVFGGRRSGYRFSRSGDWREIGRSFNAHFGAPVKRIVDSVIEQWGLESLESLLDFVYFETEPMLAAERGQFLDFQTVQGTETVSNRTKTLTFPEGFLEELRSHWEQRKRASFKSTSDFENVPYDGVTEEALRNLADEEHTSFNIPHGSELLGPDRG